MSLGSIIIAEKKLQKIENKMEVGRPEVCIFIYLIRTLEAWSGGSVNRPTYFSSV
jgi:hypothetical protein